MRKRSLVDSDGMNTGNSWTSKAIDEEESFFRNLSEQDEGCPECDYEGPLRSTRKGWKCPSCKEIVIPVE